MERFGADQLVTGARMELVTDGRTYGVRQQQLEELIGVDRRFLCAPASLLYLAHKCEHDIGPEHFARSLDFAYWNDVTRGWSRPGLSRMMREVYDVSSVSWQSARTGTVPSDQDLIRMRGIGYVDSPLETQFLVDVIGGLPTGPRGVLELVKQDIRVAVTVRPGFAANRAAHAVVLESFDPHSNGVTIFDPDARNGESVYPRELVENYLSPTGACTIVLP